ncbi:MAG: PilW family protein [Rubrivivax sp.]
MLNNLKPGNRGWRSTQSGLSLVEMLVGVVVGLLVVGAAALMTSSQLSDTRRLLIETQLQQDLRAATDIITRELRRAGSIAVNDGARSGIFNQTTPASTVSINIYDTVTVATAGDTVDYAYYRNNASTGPYGFRLSGGVIQSRLDSTVWQELTDSRVLVIDSFVISENDTVPDARLPCPKDCPTGGADSCWPTVRVRELELNITGHHPSDATVTRSIRSVIRLRNDRLTLASNTVCPP